MKIKYGTLENQIDITNICLNNLKRKNIIMIPSGEHIRTLYFTDPIFGQLKTIFIELDNETLTIDHKTKIYIDILEEKVYLDNNLPEKIKNIFFVNENIKLDPSIQQIIKNYYTDDIQTSKQVVHDIANNSINKKMLVFGLGYDSELWYNLLKGEAYFIEDNQHYIDLNKHIPNKNIIKYQYKNINVKKSFNLTDQEIDTYVIPENILDLGPFDIIYIDGPTGSTKNSPGRLIPFFWSRKFLSKSGTIIYIDDSARLLESYCIHKFFSQENYKMISYDIPCTKIVLE
jgi:hypothetical protein